MSTLKKYIALLLLVVVVFPIAFTSVHIVRHKSLIISNNGHFEHNIILDNHSKDENKNISKESEKCLIAEYQFFTNDLPKISFYESLIPVLNCDLIAYVKRSRFIEAFSEKTPRAPPVLNL